MIAGAWRAIVAASGDKQKVKTRMEHSSEVLSVS